MKEIYLILLGIFIGRYIIDILDNIVSWFGIITQHLNNIQSLKTTEIQCKIDELTGANKMDDGNRIGFQVVPEEDYFEGEQ